MGQPLDLNKMTLCIILFIIYSIFTFSCTKWFVQKFYLGNIMTIHIECKRYFVEAKNKHGETISIPVDVRKMIMSGNFIGIDLYETNVLKRNGEIKFCVKGLKTPVKKRWPMPFDPPQKPKWQREGSFSKIQFISWLSPYVGGIGQAEIIAEDILASIPKKKAA